MANPIHPVDLVDDGENIIANQELTPSKDTDLSTKNIHRAERLSILRSLEAEKDSQFLDFLDMVGRFEGVVPANFHRIFLLAQNLETLGGCQRLEEITGDKTKSTPTESTEPHDTEWQKAYTIHPTRRRSRDIGDVALLTTEEIKELGMSMPEIEMAAEQGEIRVRDFSNQEKIPKDSISSLPSHGKERLNSTDQDIYFLVDLSLSMNDKQRLLFAQTILIWFLNIKFNHQKKRPRIHLRGFGKTIGELVQAQNLEDLPEIIEEVLAPDAHQRGTHLQDAIEKAAADLHYFTDGTAEIIVLTDGLARIEPEEIKKQIPKKSKLHVILTGNDLLTATQSEIRDAGEMSEKGVNRVINNRARINFEELADTLIELDDIDEQPILVDTPTIIEIRDFLQEQVFTSTFKEAPLTTRRKAVFCNDFLVHVLTNEQVIFEDENCRDLTQTLQQRLAAWLMQNTQIEIIPEFAKRKKNKKLAKLQLKRRPAMLGVKFKRKKSLQKIRIKKSRLFILIIKALWRLITRKN